MLLPVAIFSSQSVVQFKLPSSLFAPNLLGSFSSFYRIIVVIGAKLLGKGNPLPSEAQDAAYARRMEEEEDEASAQQPSKKRKREEEDRIDIEFVQMIGEKVGEKMTVVEAVDLGATEEDAFVKLRASAADAFGCLPHDIGEMRSRLDGEEVFTLITNGTLVKRLKNMAQVRVMVRDAKDDEIDKLRAEMLLLEQNKKANGTGEAVAAVVTTATSVPSASSKSLQRLAIESLFAPVSHQNTAAMVSLFVELGLDSHNVESAEAMLSYADSPCLQRLVAGLKACPQGLFKKAFLPTN